ncbi:MAG: CCDC90 family protein [Methylobacter tundripaludum]|nr:CCDC90 family protein [Methylobacter tundripaludum]MCK9636340.1 CCDC90 family protein [Methylobacter tundripaludum]
MAAKHGKLDAKSKAGGKLMTAITFDTHKFVRTLKDAGVPESQAEAFSEAFKEAQGKPIWQPNATSMI